MGGLPHNFTGGGRDEFCAQAPSQSLQLFLLFLLHFLPFLSPLLLQVRVILGPAQELYPYRAM